MDEPARQLGRDVVALAKEQGFALAGVCDATPSDYAEQFRRYLDDGKHGTMSWLADHEDVRTDIRRLAEGVRSVLVVGDLYKTRQPAVDPESADVGTGRIARYARGDDYHTVVKKRLHAVADALRERFAGEVFRAFVDTAPVMEREQAARAGLGWIGKHTLLINPRLGSWMFLGGIAMSLPAAPPEEQAPVADHCGTCTRCIDACPTGAIAPYSVDARRCISYLTIEHREAIEPELERTMGEWIFGCDICQEVCPHNHEREAAQDSTARPEYAARQQGLNLLEVLGWTEEARRAVFTKSAMKRAKLDMMKRNAAIAAGNSQQPEPSLHRALGRLARAHDESPLVREAAARAFGSGDV